MPSNEKPDDMLNLFGEGSTLNPDRKVYLNVP